MSSDGEKAFSLLVDALRPVFMVQIIFGHGVALLLPNVPRLFSELPVDYVALFSRLIFGFGRESATWFVLVSGIYAARNFWTSTGEASSTLQTLRKRLSKIVPMGLLALAGTWVLDCIGRSVFHGEIYFRNGLEYNVGDHSGMGSFACNLIQMQPTFCLTYGSNGPIWTLGYLIQFALLSTVILLFRHQHIRIISVMIVSIGLISLTSVEFAAYFLLWLFIGPVIRWWSTKPPRHPVLCTFMAILLFAAARLQGQYASMLMVAGATILSYSAAQHIKKYRVAVRIQRYIARYSEASFGAYITHMPLMFVIVAMAENTWLHQTDNRLLLTLICSVSVVVAAFYIGSKLARLPLVSRKRVGL